MYKRCDGRKIRQEFINGVQEFLEFAKQQESYKTSLEMRCPCSKCKNCRHLDIESIREPLHKKGFDTNYYEWVYHGEFYLDLIPPKSASNPCLNMDALCPTFKDVNEKLEKVEENPHPPVKISKDKVEGFEKGKRERWSDAFNS